MPLSSFPFVRTTTPRLLMAIVLLAAGGLAPTTGAAQGAAAGAPGDTRAAQDAALDSLGHVLGLASAPVEVIEFMDFGCSQCARFTREAFAPVYREFVLSGQVRWRTIPFVMGRFRHSALAAEAAECANEQGRFLAMHEALLARQQEWTASSAPQGVFAAIAKAAGADPARYASCVKSQRMRPRVNAAKDIAMRLQVYGTPTFIVQRERRILGAIPASQFAGTLRQEVAAARR